MDYEQQAEEFLRKTNTEISIEFKEFNTYFQEDTDKRDIYQIKLTRGDREYSFNFGNSLNNSGFKLINKNNKRELNYLWVEEANEEAQHDKKIFKAYASNKLGSLSGLEIKEPKKPTAYDVLACMTKYDVGTFQEFCDEFGYSTDSIKANKTYNAVVDEYNNIKMLFNDEEIEQLREIN